jgi:CRP-like cAMP-binding protein
VATLVWDDAVMPATEDTATRLRKAMRAKTAAEKRAEAARTALAVAMADAIREGMRQSEVVKLTGYTREHVRRLVREVEERASRP